MNAKAIIMISLLLCACSHKATRESTSRKASPPERPAELSACMEYDGKPSPKNFADYDADRSGAISRNEYLCQVVKHFTLLNSDGDDYLEGEEISVPLKKSDENGDKKVSIIEFMQTAETAFDVSDKNHDGTLSREEFKAGNRRLP